ncbi:MAG: prepilin-type N-terminal cleavage/methylation domain-containing protein [Planctomycetes bacterium]|nr:prepilin-type N-terminal cleavage/methylation domain-containing protein [Planctomycetota bacterium]
MRRSIRTCPGFTLVEMLIALGAFALIALGLTTIFDSTARTVSTGRRVGAMTEYAALLESQFRADFQAMTRDGFLVIRNEYANNAREVPLHGDDRSPVPRRVDELMFFVKTPVSSAREAFAPGFRAASNEASIYYGHGQGRQLDLRQGSFYRRPRVDDPNLEPSHQLGVDPRPAERPNPNRYASSWNLLRHVTVLAQFGGSESRAFGNGAGQTPVPPGLSERGLVDGPNQIGLRPAASSPFRRIAAFDFGSENPLPQLSSGIVDIATTDLAEIREIVTTVSALPSQIRDDEALRAKLDGKTRGGLDAVGFMQAWMDDALPANSMAVNFGERSRMRAERTAPDFLGVLSELQNSTSPRAAWWNSILRADQMAIASSVFVPSCTEFIVEWTFGMVDPDGRMIWHGKDRWVDLDGDPQRRRPEEKVAWPYRAEQNEEMKIPLKLRGPRERVSPDPPGNPPRLNPAGLDAWRVIPELIHGPQLGFRTARPDEPLTSYFGYFDPTFNPDLRGDTPNSGPDGDVEDDGDALSPTLPWAWPSLIRITLTLTDPIDPTFEQTFQFVFETPGNPVY